MKFKEPFNAGLLFAYDTIWDVNGIELLNISKNNSLTEEERCEVANKITRILNDTRIPRCNRLDDENRLLMEIKK